MSRSYLSQHILQSGYISIDLSGSKANHSAMHIYDSHGGLAYYHGLERGSDIQPFV